MDIQMAVKFIRDNAKNLGGDSERITLLGESAGGQAVAYHLLNKTSASMIQTFVSQSGR